MNAIVHTLDSGHTTVRAYVDPNTVSRHSGAETERRQTSEKQGMLNAGLALQTSVLIKQLVLQIIN